MLLHNTEKFDNDLRTGTNEHLSFPGLLRVIDSVERIVENTCFDHVDGFEILNSIVGGEVSVALRKNSY